MALALLWVPPQQQSLAPLPALHAALAPSPLAARAVLLLVPPLLLLELLDKAPLVAYLLQQLVAYLLQQLVPQQHMRVIKKATVLHHRRLAHSLAPRPQLGR